MPSKSPDTAASKSTYIAPDNAASQTSPSADGGLPSNLPTENVVDPQMSAGPTRHTNFGWKIGSSLASIWLLAVVLVWLWLHAPFMPSLLSGLNAAVIAGGLLNTIINLILLPLMVLAAGALGLRLLGWFLAREVLNAGESLVVAWGLGLGAIGFLILGLGMLGWLGWPLAYGLLIGALGLNYRQTGQILSQIRQNWLAGLKWWRNSSWIPRLLIVYIASVLSLTLMSSLLPPTSWDSLMYHLAAPQLYLQNGKIGPLTQMFPSNYPFGAEMLFSWAMALHNDTLPQAMHWLFGLLTALTLILMAQRFFTNFSLARRQLSGLLAASFFLSIPLVQTLMGWAYTDLLVGFYALLALYLLLVIIQNKAQGHAWLRLAILAGVMAGLCFGGKYWAVLALAGIGLAFLAVGAQEKIKAAHLWGSAGAFSGVAALVSLPWLLRNWFFSDNPLAPFVFGARGWDKAQLNSFNTGSGVPFDPFNLLTLPWQLSVNGQTGGSWDATISPLFLALAPLIVLAVLRDRLASRAAMLAVGVQYLAWVLVLSLNSTLSETRALVPAFPLLALATAYGLVALSDFKMATLLRNFANVLVGLFLMANLFNQVLDIGYVNPLGFLTGLQPREVYLETWLGSYWRAAQFISTKLPPDAQVVSWLEPRSYYFNRATRPDFHLDEFFYYTSHYPNSDQLAAALKSRGITHLILSERGLSFMLNTPGYNRVADTKAAQPLLAQFKTTHLTLLYEEAGEYAIFSLH